jgi:2-aminoadipate transaminase
MEYRFATHMTTITGNAIREIFKLVGNPEIISFAGGMPSAESFAKHEIADIYKELLDEKGESLLQYGATDGYYPLKVAMVPFLADKGVTATEDGMMIVSGSQQSIDLMCRAFIEPGDVVLVERPTYLAVLHILATHQAKPVGVEMQDDGVDLADLEEKMRAHRPKILYLVPTFQNPTGRTMSLEKRKAVVALAKKYGVVIIEDDPYRDLRYRGEALPAIHSFDDGAHVVYSTSVSKIISPGMRVGVVVAPPEILRKLNIAKQAVDVHTNLPAQAVIAEVLNRGIVEKRLPAVLEEYKVRMHAMLEALGKYFPQEVKCTQPDGGLFIWLELPEGIDTTAIFPQAVERNVAYVPGAPFFCDGTGQNTMRLNFSASNIERIDRGMAALGGLIGELV